MAQDTQQSTFSQLLGRSLIMAIPGMISGVGQGIGASDPRQPYRGLGTGLAAGIAPMQGFAGQMMSQQMQEEAQDRRRKQARSEYATDTELMVGRESRLAEARRAMEEKYGAPQYRRETELMAEREAVLEGARKKRARAGYVEDTDLMIGRQKAIKQSEREQEAQDVEFRRQQEESQAQRDRERFRKITGIQLGMKGLDEQSKLFAAQIAASQMLPTPAMRMTGMRAASNIMGARQ